MSNATPTIDDLRMALEYTAELWDQVCAADDRFADAVDDDEVFDRDQITDTISTLRTLAEDHAERKARDRFETLGGFPITPRAA